jgi:pyruvate dehydrogenase E2 component (dihydrolipoamide acetyltransferase)
VKISPALLRKLSKAGISPELVTGSGPDGRILKEDVDRAIEQGSLGDARPVERHALNASQKKVASALSEAQSTVPIYHVRRQLCVGRALAQMKEQLPNGSGLLTALLVNAVARALARHPTLNTQFETDALKPVGALNVAVAVARDDGAVAAPVLTNIDQLSIAEIAEGLSSLVTRARAGRLVAGDVQPAAIAISNLGMYGVDDFTAMVTPPQVMVLSVGRLSVQPSWDAQTQTFVPEEQVTVTLGSDHRVVNGAQAAEFLQSLAALIEDTD